MNGAVSARTSVAPGVEGLRRRHTQFDPFAQAPQALHRTRHLVLLPQRTLPCLDD